MTGPKARGGPGLLRIIGGQWRSRRLRFTPGEGLRPTADRTRETLFNWLAPVIRGARCADLFAGSGALGLEALSRGAGHCDFVETNPTAAGVLVNHLRELDALDRGACYRQSAQSFLREATEAYDVVFIDPPFGQGLAAACCELLASRDLLRPGAFIYLESGGEEPPPPLPEDWMLHREKRHGGVAVRLMRRGTS